MALVSMSYGRRQTSECSSRLSRDDSSKVRMKMRSTAKIYTKYVGVVAVLALAVVLSGTAFATTIAFTGGEGSRWAEAEFTLEGSSLTLQLSNLSTTDALVPTDVLTAVFFSTGGFDFTPGKATLASGSTVLHAPKRDAYGTRIYNGTYAGGDVGAEWAYAAGLTGAPHGATQGVSSSGMDLFGPKDRFDTAPRHDLQSPTSPDGLQYGITTAGDNKSTGNSNMTGKYALIQGPVNFTFVVESGFTLDSIANVSFQYGTCLGEPNVPGNPPAPPSLVPEPNSMVLVGLGIAGLLLRRFRGAPEA